MTGFGAGSAALGAAKVTVEIRALNHRHQEVRVRVPAELHDHGFFLEQACRDLLGRGRFDVAARVEGVAFSRVTLDESRLREVYASVMKIARELNPDASVDIAHLVGLPEMMRGDGPPLEACRSALEQALQQAAEALGVMQEREGQQLLSDLQTRLAHLGILRAEVSDGAGELVEHRRQKLKERMDQLLADSSALPSERLDHEIALLADRSDITEELVRLGSHFEQFSSLLNDPAEVGRRLDFLLQEISREVNTIGSKSPHSKVAQLVVEMKSEVERLREQVQNVA